MLQHFSVLYITFALALLVSSAPLHGNDKIDGAVMISPQAMEVVSPARGNSINKTSRGIPSARTNTSTSRRSTTHFESRATKTRPPSRSKTSTSDSTSSSSRTSSTSTSSSGTGTPSSCSVDRLPKKIVHPRFGHRSFDGRSVHQSSTIKYLSGRDNITLFHGTSDLEEIKEFQNGIELDEPGPNDEDDNSYLVDRAFHLTDSIYAAAQRACESSLYDCDQLPRIASVAEFQWFGAGMKVKEFEMDAEFKKFHKNPKAIMDAHDMISSPTVDENKFVTNQIREYAVINQLAVHEENLQFKKVHTVHCNMVKVGHISDEQYTAGQKTKDTIADDRFTHLVRKFTKPKKETMKKGTPKDLWRDAFNDFSSRVTKRILRY